MAELPAPRRPLISITEKHSPSLDTPSAPKPSWLSLDPTQASVSDTLSFDRLANDELSYPLSRRDFLDYLIFIALSAETFQFWLWFRDYQARFAAATSQLGLSLSLSLASSAETLAQDISNAVADAGGGGGGQAALENVSLHCRDPVEEGYEEEADAQGTVLPKASFRSLTPAEARTLNDPEND
ncbi:hypothetical protein TD95_004966, partial [Thielaviopsis punctulata]